jgi:hypothetical protein
MIYAFQISWMASDGVWYCYLARGMGMGIFRASVSLFL